MPVKWLLHWQPNSGAQLGSQTLMVDVMKSIESINGIRSGRWQVTASQYRPIQRDASLPIEYARELLGLTFSEVPNKQFFVLRTERMVVEAAASMQQIMEKLQVYRQRMTIIFEGFQFQLGDFQIKAGRAVLAHSETLRGIVMEVEYLPVSSLEQTHLLLQEFVDLWQDVISAQAMAGRFVPLEANYAEYGLQDNYSWKHTSLQYVSAMVHFMSSRTTA